MAFRAEGFKTFSEIGTPDNTAGSYRSFHGYDTNDDGPTVETANYFDALLLQQGRVKVGDIIMASLDNDGTPLVRHYVVTSVTTHLTIAHESTGAGAGLMVIPFYVSLADIAGAQDVVTDYTPGFAFKIEGIDFAVSKPVTTAAKLATLTPKVSDAAVTGGALALTSANCTPAGKVVAGAAITAGNVGAATDTISISASAVTAFSEGAGTILLKVRNLDG